MPLGSVVHSSAIRLIVATGVIMMIGTAIILAVTAREEKKALFMRAVESASSSSGLIKKSIRYQMLKGNRDAIRGTVQNLAGNGDIRKITIYDHHGRIACSSATKEAGAAVPTSPGPGGHAVFAAAMKRTWRMEKTRDGDDLLVLVDPIYNERSCSSAECHHHPGGMRILGFVQTDFAVSTMYAPLGTKTGRNALFPVLSFWLASLAVALSLRRYLPGSSPDHPGDSPGGAAVAPRDVPAATGHAADLGSAVFESIGDPFIVVDRDYRIVKANEAYARLRGIPLGVLMNARCHEVIYGRDSRCSDCTVEKTFRSGDPCAADKRVMLKGGEEAWLEVYTYPVCDDSGNVTHTIEYSRDVTDRKKAEKTMKRDYLELEQIFDTAADAMCVIDVNFRILRTNSAFHGLVGRSRGDVVGRKCHEVFAGPECGSPHCPLAKLLREPGGIIHFESGRNLGKGKDAHFIITATAFRGPDGELMGIVEDFKDISDMKRTENELRTLSLQDELTGLCNRRGFLTLVSQELKRADRIKQSVFLLYCDLDGLKDINDTFGHDEGDRALKEVAAVLGVTFRNSDIIARIGGDEFVVVPVGTAGDNIDTATGRLQRNIDACNRRLSRPYTISLSIGVACYDPESPCTVKELMVRADASMYREKRRRKG